MMALTGSEEFELRFVTLATIATELHNSFTCSDTAIDEINTDDSGNLILTDLKGKKLSQKRLGSLYK